jgi:hypothetical protein
VVAEVMWVRILSRRQMAGLLVHTYPYAPDESAVLAAAAALHAPPTRLSLPAQHINTFSAPAVAACGGEPPHELPLSACGGGGSGFAGSGSGCSSSSLGPASSLNTGNWGAMGLDLPLTELFGARAADVWATTG